MTSRDSYRDLVEKCDAAGYRHPRVAACKVWVVGWGIRLIERREAADWNPDVDGSDRSDTPSPLQKIAFLLAIAILTLFVAVVLGPVPYGPAAPESVSLAEVGL